MKLRDPSNRDDHDRQRPKAEHCEAGNLDDLRQTGEAFLAAGDEAIRRALSGDSEAFLRANRQQGGQ
jgi:hypothetical protein